MPAAMELAGLQILEGISDVELDPKQVDELYDEENPLNLSPAKRAVIVESLRRQRTKHFSKKKAKRTKVAKTPAEVEGLTLEDLNLDVTALLGES